MTIVIKVMGDQKKNSKLKISTLSKSDIIRVPKGRIIKKLY
jgi:hypothetical protein